MNIAYVLVLLLLSANTCVLALQTPAPATPAARQQQGMPAPLTNEDVVQMLKTGISAEIVIAKIKSSPNSFDTSPSALQELKAEQVPDGVLLAMVNPKGVTPTVPATPSEEGMRAQEISLSDGTPLSIQLASNLSSATAKEGDLVSFTVVEPVMIDGVVVIQSGAPATARVVAAKKAGHWGRAGKLSVVLQHVVAADGSRVSLRMSKKMVGDSKGATVATATIVTGVIFLPAAPLWGFRHGKNAVFPAGKQFEAFVHGDTKVSIKVASERSVPR